METAPQLPRLARQVQWNALRLGDVVESDYKAIAHDDQIREVGKLLRAIGDELDARYSTVSDLQQARRKAESLVRPSWFHSFVDVVDTILEWLEHAGKDAFFYLKKKETVLRGIFHMTELASQVNLFEILEYACSFLDVPEDPFPGQREYVVRCLKDIEEQRLQIGQLVEEASKILRDILRCDDIDLAKGRQFDNIVREAHVQINSCNRRLAGAEKAILQLSAKMTTIKWFSRGFRITAWGVSCYYFYQKYQESTISLPVFFAGSAVAGVAWLSLFPSRAYKYYESLSKLASEHRLLKEKLDDLHVSLSSSQVYVDGAMQKRKKHFFW